MAALPMAAAAPGSESERVCICPHAKLLGVHHPVCVFNRLSCGICYECGGTCFIPWERGLSDHAYPFSLWCEGCGAKTDIMLSVEDRAIQRQLHGTNDDRLDTFTRAQFVRYNEEKLPLSPPQ